MVGVDADDDGAESGSSVGSTTTMLGAAGRGGSKILPDGVKSTYGIRLISSHIGAQPSGGDGGGLMQQTS